MNWILNPWHRSQAGRPRKQSRPHLFESLENRALMAGDLHALHAPPSSHGHATTAHVLHQTGAPAIGLIHNSGGTATAAPGVPTGVTAEAYDGAVKLSWTAPTSTGGAERIGYVVQYSTDSGATWTAVNHRFGETHAVVPMLTNGTSYVFEVAAVNRAGQSAFSDMSAAVTPVAATAPGVPTGVTAEAYDGCVKLSWTAPTSTGGAERIGYVVQYSTDSGATWTAVNHRFGETHAVVPMLTNGTSYVFEVAAVNRAGQSGFSDMSAAVTPVAATAPGVPTGVTAEAYPGAVKLSWTAPASTGGTDRIGYVVQYSTDSGATWTPVTRRFGETHAVIPMLNSGTSYVFQVAAVNRAGQSGFSDASAAVTPLASTTQPTSGRHRGTGHH